jgi:hypothetical protein
MLRRFLLLLGRPFVATGRWYRSKGFVLKAVLGLIVLGVIVLYGFFIWQTLWIRGFNPDYATAYNFDKRGVSAGEQVAAEGAGATTKTCGRSAIVDVTADLIDLNVNKNEWIPSMLLYKLGLFGLPWDATPFLDNKASFQRGVQQAIQRTAVELTDQLGRVRGTSAVDPDLQSARGNLQFDESTWYFALSPFGPKTPTPSFYRAAIKDLRKFNTRLESCDATFDARADNLVQFTDRIAKDIGSTSAAIKDRAEQHNSGWFDTRADNLFWYSYGQLYGYYGILEAAQADFDDVIKLRRLTDLWNNMEGQIRSALKIQPLIVSNGAEDGWIMPTHLTTMGFYILRVRSNLVEIRSVLER